MCSSRPGSGRSAGQREAEAVAAAAGGADPDPAALALDDLPADRQTQPRAADAALAAPAAVGSDPPLVWGDVDAVTGTELWWLLPSGLNELDRLEALERP